MPLTEQEYAKAKSLKEQGYSSQEVSAFIMAERTGKTSSIHREEQIRADEDANFKRNQASISEKITKLLSPDAAVDVFGSALARRGIGTDVDPEVVQQYVAEPTAGEKAGALLQTGSIALSPIAGPASITGQVLYSAGLGYMYDVGSDLIENKSAQEVITPGMETAIGAGAPLAFAGAGRLYGAVRGATSPATKLAGEAVEDVVQEGTEAVTRNLPVSGVQERATEFIKRFPRAAKHVDQYLDEGAEIAARKASGGPAVANALDEGLSLNTVDFVDNFDDVTRAKAIEMLDLAEAPRGAARPETIPANIAGDQFELIVNERKAIGQQIGDLSRSLGDESYDMLPSLRGLRQSLLDNGIEPFKDGLRFSAMKYTPKQQELIQQAYDLATTNEVLTATQIHEMDQLFSKLQREARFDGLDDVYIMVRGTDGNFHEVNLFKKFRDVFSQKLDTIDGGAFKKINSEYRFYRNLQDELEATIFSGAKQANLPVDPADSAVNNMRRLFSNAVSQPRFETAYNALDDAARKLDYQGARADELYDFYLRDMKPLYPDTVQPASLEGGFRGALDAVIGKVTELGRPTYTDKQRALRGLLNPETLPTPAAPTEVILEATDAADMFEKPGFIERAKEALKDNRGAINPNRSVERLRESSPKNIKLTDRGKENIARFLAHIDGTKKLPAQEWKELQSTILDFANKTNMKTKGGGNKEIAKELADTYGSEVRFFNQSATTKTTDLLEEARKMKAEGKTFDEFLAANYVENKPLMFKGEGISKATYKLPEVVDNPVLFDKYPALRDYNVHFAKGSVNTEAAGITGRSIRLTDRLYDNIPNQKRADELKKQLQPYLDKEAAGTLTDAEYKKAVAISDELGDVEAGRKDAIGVQLNEDGMRALYHEIQHAKQGTEGYVIKDRKDFLSDTAEFSDNPDYWRDKTEVDARFAETKWKSRKELEKIWERANQ